MKLFGGDMVTKVFNKLGADENMPIEFKPITKAVENAQKKVESRNFSIRKHVLNYDDVMNTQREIIYKQRREVLDGADLKDVISNMINFTAESVVETYEDELNTKKDVVELELQNRLNISGIKALEKDKVDFDEVLEEVKEKAQKKYEEKEKEIGEEQYRELERIIMLKVVDEKWMDHIDSMDALKDGIGLRAYGQKDPVAQYRIEGFEMFDAMINDIKLDVSKLVLSVKKREGYERRQTAKVTSEGRENIDGILNPDGTRNDKEKTAKTPIVNDGPKVGRNDPCPCGSGKKYKNCCGRNQ